MSGSALSHSRRSDPALREAIITGLLGAAVVAVFYLVLDLLRGRPLVTPSVLGQAFILHQPPSATVADPAAVILYTAFHLAAFLVFGLFLTVLVRAAEESPLARYALVQLLIVFELFFFGLLSIASETTRGLFSLWGVLAANTLAGAVMVGWQWRHHPRLRLVLESTPLGAAEAVPPRR